MDFAELVRTRTMTRAFDPTPIDRELLESLVDAATRSPSAGKAQGFDLVVFEGSDTTRFWDVTLPSSERANFAWPRLLDAPVIALVCADPHAYLARYSEPDKARTGLGDSTNSWPAPYWTIDASFATMTLLYAAHDAGLGALFFAVARGADEIRRTCNIPDHVEMLGALALGWPHAQSGVRKGRSAPRARRAASSVLRFNSW